MRLILVIDQPDTSSRGTTTLLAQADLALTATGKIIKTRSGGEFTPVDPTKVTISDILQLAED